MVRFDWAGEGEGDELPQRAQELWEKVFRLSNTILHQHKMYGFDEICERAPQPNVETIVKYCRFFDTAFQSVMRLDELGLTDLGYDSRRGLLNAKAQITAMEQLATAVQAENRADYDAAVKSLENQAPF